MTPTKESEPTDTSSSVIPASLNQMFEDLDRTANEIVQGEFSEHGAGHSGIAFRNILIKPDEDMDEVWSMILSLCNQLWENGHQKSSINLVKTSALWFHVPDSVRDRVTQSTVAAEDTNAAIEAELKFQQGDDDAAIRFAERANGEAKSMLTGHFTRRIKKRKQIRLAAIWVAGTSISMLSVMGIIGFMSFVEMIKEPPRVIPPKYQDSERIFNGLFNSSSVEYSNQSNLKPVKPQVTTYPEVSPKPKEATADNFINLKYQKETVDTAPLVNVPEKNASTVTRSNCIVGFAALQQTLHLLENTETPEIGRKKAEQFKSDLTTSCKPLNIDPMDLNLEASSVDTGLAKSIAEGILK